MTNHSYKFRVLVVAAFTKKKEERNGQRQRQQTNQTHSLLLNIVVLACESYLFCDSYECRFMESRNQQHHAYC